MKKKDSKLLVNSSVSFISQVVTLLFSFVTRSLLVKHIGVEVLGLHSTFASILNTLSLADLGLQTAIVYSLYAPIQSDRKAEINDIVNILKLLYRGIGIFFLVVSLALVPVIHVFITGVIVTNQVRAFFILQSISTGCSYFFAYKRTLLFADQRDYVTKTVDLWIGLIFRIAQCVVIVLFRDYLGYLILTILQVFLSNLIIHLFCGRDYDYLHKSKINCQKLREIWSNVKDIFVGRIAGYVYGSTGNLVISKFVNVASVGYLGNYTTITTGIKVLLSSLLNPVTPLLGSMFAGTIHFDKKKTIFEIYTFICFALSCMVVAPVVSLSDEFICIWVGKQMVMPFSVTLLLGLDLYIHLIHNPCVDYLRADGYFRQEKKVQLAGAFCCLGCSLALVFVAQLEGVLLAMVLSQIVFWLGRSYYVFKKSLETDKKDYFLYWTRVFLYTVAIIALVSCQVCICKTITIGSPLLQFFIHAVASEVMAAIVIVFVLCLLPERSMIFQLIKRKIKK